MKKNYNATTLIGTLFVLAILQGCDQISKITEYFGGKMSSQKTAATPSEVLTPATQPMTSEVPAEKAALANKAIPKDVLVQVGSWTLTLEEFNNRLKALKELAPDYDIKDVEQKKLILEELIRQELLVQDAVRTGIDNKKEIVEAVDEFRRTLLVREVATKIVENIEATEQEASDYYNANKADFTEPTEWHLREIVVETEEEAKGILVELYQGADFAETVKQKSKGKSAWQKGDLGFVSTFDFPKMEDVVRALEVGQISTVFKGPEGFYIVKLEEKKGGAEKKFDDIKNEIKTGLTLLKQQQALLNYLEELRKKTDIQINENLLSEEKAQ